MGRLGCLLEAPGGPWEARPPKAPQRHSKDADWVVWGCLLEVSGPPLGGLPAPKGTPKSLQGRGQYEASDPKLKQTKASTLALHNSSPQGLWSSRVEAEYAKRKQFKHPPPNPQTLPATMHSEMRRPKRAFFDAVPGPVATKQRETPKVRSS